MRRFITFLSLLFTLYTIDAQEVYYKVGDYYNRNGKQGIVFEVDSTGLHGKIVSLRGSEEVLQWSTFDAYTKNLHGPIGTTSESDGIYNMEQVSKIEDWQSKFPAFAWCASLGDGWYLPAQEELERLMNEAISGSALNSALQSRGEELFDGGLSQHWSSTQYGKYMAINWFYRGGGNLIHLHKYYHLKVRAIAKF